MPVEGPLVLTYFDARGRGEVIRLALAYGKIDYKDVRIEFKDWADLKKKTPWGGLPMMEINGELIGQGMALSVFAGKEAGLYPTDNFEALRVDEILNAREDLMMAEGKPHFEKDEEKKAELLKTLMEDVYPVILGKFNSFIKDNKAKSGYAIGSNMTLADIIIFEGTQSLSEHQPEMLDKYPEIKALRPKVANAPGIKEYLAKRPKTTF